MSGDLSLTTIRARRLRLDADRNATPGAAFYA